MVQVKKSLMFVMLVMAVLVAGVFATVDENDKFKLEKVEINGHLMSDDDTISVENGDTLDIEVELEAKVSSDTNRIRVWLNGYEHDALLDTVGPFSAKQGKTTFKTLSINLPSDMISQEDYTLKIEVEGIVKEYELYVDTQRHRVDTLDLIMTPSYGVEAGQNVIAEVRLKNRGQKDQETVKVTINIPELGVSGSGYVSNLDNTESVSSDEILLFIPENAEAGEYDVIVETKYNDYYSNTKSTFKMSVLASKVVEEKSLIASLKKNIDLVAGETYDLSVIIGNENEASKPVSIVSGENNWAYVEVVPSFAMIQGGTSANYIVKVTPKSDISGEKILTLDVKEGTSVISSLKVNAYVEKEETNVVNLVLGALLVIAIIVLISLMVSISRKKNNGEKDEFSSNEEYY